MCPPPGAQLRCTARGGHEGAVCAHAPGPEQPGAGAEAARALSADRVRLPEARLCLCALCDLGAQPCPPPQPMPEGPSVTRSANPPGSKESGSELQVGWGMPSLDLGPQRLARALSAQVSGSSP